MKPPFWPLIAAGAGLITVGTDLAGMTGHSFFWSVLELLCGLVAALGMAALWKQDHFFRQNPIATGILLVSHIAEIWLWLPFFLAMCIPAPDGRPGKRWLKQVIFLEGLLFFGTAGMGLFYWGWSEPLPDIAPLQTWGGLAAALMAAWLLPRFALEMTRQEALVVWCRIVSVLAGVFLAGQLVKLSFRPPLPVAVYGVLALILAGAIWGGWRQKLPSGSCYLVHGAAAGLLLLTASHLALDCWVDKRYFGNEKRQKYSVRYFHRHTAATLPACREYYARHGAWPETPEAVAALQKQTIPHGQIILSGGHTDEKGDYRLFMRRPANIMTMAYCFRADGTEGWEIIAQDHPMLKPGDRRWKHRFPHTDR